MLLSCKSKTRAQFWDSANPQAQDEWLDDAKLESKLSDISNMWSSEPDPSQSQGRFLLVSAVGDTATSVENDLPLDISSTLLHLLLETSQVSHYAKKMLARTDFHMSHHMHFSPNDNPSGLTIAIRCPPNIRTVSFVMRIRFADRSCVCFLFAYDSQTLEKIRNAFINDRKLLEKNPLQALVHLYWERKDYFGEWQAQLVTRVREAETASAMVPETWAVEYEPERLSRLRNLDEPYLLNHMYAAHTELCYTRVFSQWAVRFGKCSIELFELIEKSRISIGLSESLTVSCRSDFEEAIRFAMDQWILSQDVIGEMLERVQGQINVVFSLIAQRESKISRQLAEDSKYVSLLAAQDSKTMKTIAVITLIFLPAALTTALWSSNIFTIPGSQNYKVFIGTTIGATVLALTIYVLFDQRPLPLPPSSQPSSERLPPIKRRPLFDSVPQSFEYTPPR